MSNHLFSIFPNEQYVDLNLYQYGWEECLPLHSFGPAARNHYLFHYVISGSGTLDSTDSKGSSHIYRLGPDKGFLIVPEQVNTYYADQASPWEYVWLEFDGLRAKEFLEVAGLTMDFPVFTPKSREEGHMVKEQMLYLAQNSNESSLNLIGHLFLFLDCLVKASASNKPIKGGKLRDFYIREAISFIEQNYQEDITVEDIAARCNLNRSYFGKIFRDALSTSPQEFLIHYRMTKATELLKLSDLTIGQISSSVGYPNQLHFSRAFKNLYGISPREWREENKYRRPIPPQ